MANMPPVRIAVAGAGVIGRTHIRHALAEPEVRLAAIIDPSPAAKTLAGELGVPWHPGFADLVAVDKPDGVIFATPNQMHVENGLEAIAAGVPVLVEKPLADDVASAAKLVAAADAAGVALLVGHHRRHNPMVAKAKEIIASGRLGRIIAVHGFFWLMKPDDYFEPAWRRAKGAGPVLTNLIHDVDLLRHLVGDVESVQAFSSNIVRGHAVEETAVVLLRFVSGALGTFNVSDTVVAPWSWEQTTGENRAYPQADQNAVHIGGTHGSLAIPRLEVWSNAGKRSWFEPLRAERTHALGDDPLRRQMQQFVRVIRGEEPPLVPGSEGLETLRVIEAVASAARTGQMIRVA